MNEEIKYCKFCGKEKPIKDFVKSGFCVKNICKDCNNKKQKDVYKNSKNYHKLQQENQQLKEQLERSERARKEAIKYVKKTSGYDNPYNDTFLNTYAVDNLLEILDKGE